MRRLSGSRFSVLVSIGIRTVKGGRYLPILTVLASSVPSARCKYVPLACSFWTMSDIVPGAPAFTIFVLSVTFKGSDSHPLIMGPTVNVFAF